MTFAWNRMLSHKSNKELNMFLHICKTKEADHLNGVPIHLMLNLGRIKYMYKSSILESYIK